MTTDRENLHDLAEDVLGEAVRLGTGNPTARPREGQLRLMHDILDSMLGTYSTTSKVPGHLCGKAPTGSGKSFAALVCACILAVEKGERSVVSTESLALQGQYMQKDFPVVADAVEKLTGTRPTAAVLMGWSNSSCAVRTAGVAQEVLGDEAEAHPDLEQLAERVDALAAKTASQPLPAPGLFSRHRTGPAAVDSITVDGAQVPRDELLALLSWSLRQSAAADDDHPGDRHSYDGALTNSQTWGMVSISPAECPGRDSCPFGEVCRPAARRDKAAEANIMITNHSMLAVQAALDVPVVVGSRALGVVRHLVIDEAHGLPTNVRNQGARTVSARRVADIGRMFERLMVIPEKSETQMSPNEKRLSDLVSGGKLIADLLDGRLSTLAGLVNKGEQVHRVAVDADPLEELGDQIVGWLKAVKRMVPSPDDAIGMKDMVNLRRAHAKLESFISDVDAARTGRVGAARWVESGERETQGRSRFAGGLSFSALKTSPVEISGSLRANLYTVDVLAAQDTGADGGYIESEDEEGNRDIVRRSDWLIPEDEWCDPGRPNEKIPPRYALSVSAISATMTRGFVYEAGLDTQLREYPSPFTDAYARSALYVPRATEEADVKALTSPWSKSAARPKFDTKSHVSWAADHIDALVSANGGSALVLSASAEAGKAYVARLRGIAAGRWAVHSQWDGLAVRQVVAAWRSDVGSVLVGTRSLMTGVDAPGETCSLVIIDRIPRAAGNPVDDARVEIIMERQQMDRWSADRYVYVSDAALLLAQASGRLIRSTGDSGVVAVLDPRLLKVGPFAYGKSARDDYMKALEDFGNRFTAEASVIAHIQELRRAAAA